MQDFGAIISIPDFSKLDGAEAMKALHDAAPEIASEVISHIRERTPWLTGALREDEDSKLGNGSLLVTWYAHTDAQTSEWGRPYGQYQEGGALGASTYTNGPHEMFARVATDDRGAIEAWANKVVDQAISNMTGAAIAGTETLEI
jgi:hypothetical protein